MIVTKKISLPTKGNCDIIDITPQVEKQVDEINMNSGTATLFVTGSTAGITTIEFESGLLSDFKRYGSATFPKIPPMTMTAVGVMATATLTSVPHSSVLR